MAYQGNKEFLDYKRLFSHRGNRAATKGVSFLVQLVFPWELETLGNSTTFLLFGSFAVVGLVIVLRLLPETKGKSLEELEAQLVHKP